MPSRTFPSSLASLSYSFLGHFPYLFRPVSFPSFPCLLSIPFYLPFLSFLQPAPDYTYPPFDRSRLPLFLSRSFLVWTSTPIPSLMPLLHTGRVHSPFPPRGAFPVSSLNSSFSLSLFLSLSHTRSTATTKASNFFYFSGRASAVAVNKVFPFFFPFLIMNIPVLSYSVCCYYKSLQFPLSFLEGLS